ncbi:Uncharacterised protein [Collinsella sp. AK_207A]|uniref:DUF5692 family protein n=1 Tax=Collinsella sp. AK_207A TaxID=2650472 RepID=UPI00126057EA|nr:DUF5692 family protein [Collinsella sp. AK_207A]VWL88493.1 Uncharacterised protein [Collinsella sp. AK_207A]
MLFDHTIGTTGFQILGWVMVFVGLILANEFARRSKAGGIIMFAVVPAIVTVYCLALIIGVAQGQQWAIENPTTVYQNSWFHYAKMYAALAGCIGFMVIKYHWGALGRARWFRAWPFVIVAINILIAVGSDFESAYHFFALGETTWVTSEGATQLAGWNNVFNGIAGIINIFCMTGWWSVYSSKDESDMLWPDMTWVYIIAYDIWNFCYTYNCLPHHAWYCGLALLLAPTVAAFAWNKGGWIQNRAFTLAIWCMFAQCFPAFQETSVFATKSTLDPTTATVVSILALVANIAAIIYIAYRAKKLNVNPYKEDVFRGTSDWEKATARREDAAKDPAIA